MTLRDAFGNAEANALANFVGMGELHGIDLPVSPLQLLPGDTVALMSDGVYRALSADELIACLEGGDPAAAAERLRAAVARKAFPTQDNYTAVVVGIDAQ